MRASALPFDDIRNLLPIMPSASATRSSSSRGQFAALGRLQDLSEFLLDWRDAPSSAVERPLLVLFAAAHGVEAHLPSLPGADARAKMDAIAAGAAPVNRVCAAFDVGLKVFELALDHPTGDITQEPALEEAACAATIAYGMEAIAGGADLLCIGALNAASTIPAAAILNALYGGQARDWTGSSLEYTSAADLVARAVQTHGATRDPLEILRRLGGRDIAAMVGAILAARMERIPIVLDGFAAAAAAAVLHALAPSALDHCVAADALNSAHEDVLGRLGKRPLLALDLHQADGCGAALTIGLFKAAFAACAHSESSV